MPTFDSHCYLGPSIVPGATANAEAILGALKTRKTESAVLLSRYAQAIDPLVGNRLLKAALDQSEGLYGCLVTHTNRIGESVAVMREMMHARRFVAMAITSKDIEKPLHPGECEEILNSYRRYGKPLFLYTPNAATVEAGLEIARVYPTIKTVFLGMGGPDWHAAVAAAHACTNIMLETSGPPDSARILAGVETLGAHRLLFGSGHPDVDSAAAAAMIEDAALSEDGKRHILHLNAKRLFRLAD